MLEEKQKKQDEDDELSIIDETEMKTYNQIKSFEKDKVTKAYFLKPLDVEQYKTILLKKPVIKVLQF